MATPEPLKPRAIDWVARARGVAPLIAAESGRTERDGRVTGAVMAAMHEAELYRLCLPRSLGGGEASPAELIGVVETVAAADASTAWCLGQALGCSLSAAFLAPDVAREIFGPPGAVCAWGPVNKTARAVPAEGGWRLTGRWSYASGIRNANWLGAHFFETEPDGTPLVTPEGRPRIRTLLFPAGRATVEPVWDTMGLRGTGSDDYAVDDLFVPEGRSFLRDHAPDRREDGPLYRVALTAFYGMTFAGVALGIARAALDEFIAVAAAKTPSYTAATLRDSTAVQSDVALAEGHLGASRAYMLEMAGEAWQALGRGEALDLDRRARLRIACAYASARAREVVAMAYHRAGATAIHARNPFERRFRDMNTVAQQVQAAPSNFENAGKAILGLDPVGQV